MFIFLLCWVPSEALSYDPQICVPQTLGPSSKGYQLCSLSCRPFRTKLPPCSSPGTLLSESCTNALWWGTYGARSWVRPFCRCGLIGGRTGLLLISSPLLRVSRICSVSVTTPSCLVALWAPSIPQPCPRDLALDMCWRNNPMKAS